MLSILAKIKQLKQAYFIPVLSDYPIIVLYKILTDVKIFPLRNLLFYFFQYFYLS